MRLLDLDLEVYQGPFDLLFTLILKDEVDIFEVSLLEIITAYLEELAESDRADWESLTEFMVLVGSLLHIKVRRLLPGQVEEEGEELSPAQAREQLLARLLAYQRIKGAAQNLTRLALQQCGRAARPPSIPQTPPLPPLQEVVPAENPAELATQLRRLLQLRREPDASHLSPIRVDVKRQLAVLRRLLRSRLEISFQESFGNDEAVVQAVTLLAILELLAKGELEATQIAPFADIQVRSCRRVC